MRRRDFIKGIAGSATSWPLAAPAQQPMMPVIGFIDAGAPDDGKARFVAAFRKGLNETGYVEGQNVTVEYQDGDRLRGRVLPPGVASLKAAQPRPRAAAAGAQNAQ
jgi:putative ABC transport system substrate-binding protein